MKRFPELAAKLGCKLPQCECACPKAARGETVLHRTVHSRPTVPCAGARGSSLGKSSQRFFAPGLGKLSRAPFAEVGRIRPAEAGLHG